MTHNTIHVGPVSGVGAYDVLIGRGLAREAAAAVPQTAARVLIAHANAVADLVSHIRTALRERGVEVVTVALPDGEQAKTVEVLANAWSVLGQASFTRTDVVMGVGGGAVTDVAGFIAASWLRGVEVIQVPTTLLGMVDAAVGGKTGINTAEGKNLVGAFHPPAAVICDLDTLDTLPAADLTAGLAEVIKCGFIADDAILRVVETHDPSVVKDPSASVLPELVGRAVAVKAHVVTEDLRESSLREVLNYGHTFAHAIEQVEDFTWRHGDAVAVGMLFVVELAREAGSLPAGIADDVVARHRRVLTRVGLPTSYDGSSYDGLLTVMARDKKSRGSSLRFVVLTGREGALDHVGRLTDPHESALRAALSRVRSQERRD